MTRAPARERRGPGLRVKNTIYRQLRRLVVSAPAAVGGVGCEDRISVTGDHLSFDGDCGDRPRAERHLVAGDPTVFSPPFPLLPISGTAVLPTGVRAPRNLMAPNTCGELP